MPKPLLLYLIILIEGYVVLASEMLAIRSLIPFIGSGIETISIIISAVLLPLSAGYYAGGKTTTTRIRQKLIANTTAAMLFLGIGLSYPFLEIFFAVLGKLHINNYLAQTAIYSILFISYPVFLLGQTIPLVSNYFTKNHLSSITGRMLAFSTIGSFLGSVFSTIVLSMVIGVHNTISFTLALLLVIIFLLTRRKFSFDTILGSVLLIIIIVMNSTSTMHSLGVLHNNKYNLVKVHTSSQDGHKTLLLNRSGSSGISSDNQQLSFEYTRYIHNNFIAPIMNSGSNKNILILGAGGFTLGLNDHSNNYTYIDIDSELKNIAEQDFLKQELLPNKKFIAASARAFAHNAKEKYDLVVIDLYSNIRTIPAEAITREFLLDIKTLTAPNGIVIANIIGNAAFTTKFDVRYNNTFASVFPNFSRQIISGFNPWQPGPEINLLYIFFNNSKINDQQIYTDNLHTYSLDKSR